jgi:hypothetical protein
MTWTATRIRTIRLNTGITLFVPDDAEVFDKMQ